MSASATKNLALVNLGTTFSFAPRFARSNTGETHDAPPRTTTQAYRTPDSQLVKLFCCGFYEEIMVVDPFSLEILFRLSSRINSDWISAFHVIRPRNRQDDVVLAITTTGAVKASAQRSDISASVRVGPLLASTFNS